MEREREMYMRKLEKIISQGGQSNRDISSGHERVGRLSRQSDNVWETRDISVYMTFSCQNVEEKKIGR